MTRLPAAQLLILLALLVSACLPDESAKPQGDEGDSADTSRTSDTADTSRGADTGDSAETGDTDTGSVPTVDCSRPRDVAESWTITGPSAEADAEALCAGGAVALRGSVEVYETELTDLTSLGCICSVRYDVLVHDNAGLTSLDGLQTLTDDVWSLEISANAVTSLDPLDGVTATHEARISGEPDLTSLAGLHVSSWLNMGLVINDCDSLVDLEGIEGLDRVGSYVIVADNDALASLAGLGELTDTDFLTLRGNASLRDLRGIGAMRLLYNLNVRGTSLESLAGLESLEEIGLIQIIDDASLTSLDALAPTTLWNLNLQNSALRDLRGLDAVTELEILRIGNNPDLVDLSGLGAVESVNVEFTLNDNAVLEALAGLEAVSTIDTTLVLQSNALLEDVTALHGVESVSSAVFVQYNPSLSSADAQALVDAIGSIGGPTYVSDNGP